MSDLRCTGCGRDANNSLAVYFNRRPTDDEVRFIHECIRRAACLAEAPEPDAAQAKLRLVPLEGDHYTRPCNVALDQGYKGMPANSHNPCGCLEPHVIGKMGEARCIKCGGHTRNIEEW